MTTAVHPEYPQGIRHTAYEYKYFIHSSLPGQVVRLGKHEYFLPYPDFPHGSRDCAKGSVAFDEKLCAKVEEEREKAFYEHGTVSKGMYQYSQMCKDKDDKEFIQTLTPDGKVSNDYSSEDRYDFDKIRRTWADMDRLSGHST